VKNHKLSSEDNLKSILQKVKNIAIVGASSNSGRDSFKVMKFLIDYGYKVFPVNPNEKSILGIECFPDLKSINKKIDMIEVFRAKKHVYNLTKEAIEIDIDILWFQEGIIHKKAASLARKYDIKVIMDKCPKKILEA